MQRFINIIIEDGYNTSYIYSLFIGLFYKYTPIRELLSIDPHKTSMIYLQELIKDKILDPIRSNRSIMGSSLNEIRNYMYITKVIDGEIEVMKNIRNIYVSFMKKIPHFSIKFAVLTNGQTITKSYDIIDITLNPDKTETNLSDLFMEWIKSNIMSEDTTKYKLDDFPYIIPFYINRIQHNGNANPASIDIMHKIKFNNIDDRYQNCMYWDIHSIICWDYLRQSYYAVVNDSKKDWIMFSDFCVPSGYVLDMSNTITSVKIKKECCLVLYQSK